MTHLRKIMLEELGRRNFAETTKQCYLHAVEEFAAFFHRPPDQLGPEHIREFQAHLFTERRLAPNTVNQRLAALRFFFVKTLKRNWNAAETPYPRKVVHLPIVLSPEEVARLIDSAATPFQRVVLMTLYATGMREAMTTRNLQQPISLFAAQLNSTPKCHHPHNSKYIALTSYDD